MGKIENYILSRFKIGIEILIENKNVKLPSHPIWCTLRNYAFWRQNIDIFSEKL